MGTYYNPRIVTDGLVLALDAANPKSYPGSGTTWTDLSSKKNHGTLVNGVGYSPDNNGYLSLDGVDDYINCGDGSNLIIGNSDFTISLWIKTPITSTGGGSPSAWGPIISKGCSTGAPAGSWWIAQYSTTNNRISFNGSSEAGGTFIIFLNTPVLTDGWHHVVVCRSGTNAYIYTDGVLRSTDTDATTNLNNTSPLLIGRNTLASAQRVNTSISSITFYNRALSPAEIKQNFNATRGRYGI